MQDGSKTIQCNEDIANCYCVVQHLTAPLAKAHAAAQHANDHVVAKDLIISCAIMLATSQVNKHCCQPVCEEADLALAVAAIIVAAQLCAVATGVQPILEQAAGSRTDTNSSRLNFNTLNTMAGGSNISCKCTSDTCRAAGKHMVYKHWIRIMKIHWCMP